MNNDDWVDWDDWYVNNNNNYIIEPKICLDDLFDNFTNIEILNNIPDDVIQTYLRTKKINTIIKKIKK